ncbi:uncharacterized protein B0H18DRAFT_358621 [Fomitopsis serialis]|uniref:uncharacterized protein n=1 Tax=Fomitopsis serialis TaxID=139415 RepID=UPI0020081E39|nr:uncharacterized protein B0H18DRAFT_358621 [Neoantrodia serialis]KAH9925968.1 hypothetical protein B0H18DRAFT_358621 [Neoantrodia serialis]
MSRLSSVPPALPPVPTVSGWLADFNGQLRPLPHDRVDNLRNQWDSRPAQSSTRSQPFTERRREHPIGPEEALRRLREIQQSLEEYLQGTSTSLDAPSATSPSSPDLTGLPPHAHSRHYHRDPDHGDAEADPLTAELSLIREAVRRLQARARQIEAVQRARGDAGTENHPQSAAEDREAPSSRRSSTNEDLLPVDRDDALFPLSLVASNRRRRSLYATRPGASNSLMSENAAEFRSRRAREQMESISAEGLRASVGSHLRFSPVDWSLPGVDDDARSNVADEPHFTPADWSLPSFRGSTRADDQGRPDTRRSQPQRARPTPMEPHPYNTHQPSARSRTELEPPRLGSVSPPLPSMSASADQGTSLDHEIDFTGYFFEPFSPSTRARPADTSASRGPDRSTLDLVARPSSTFESYREALDVWVRGDGPDEMPTLLC